MQPSRYVVSLAVLLVLGLVCPVARAEIVSADSLEWIMADADLVVRGQVSAVQHVVGADNVIWERITIKVAETLKGAKKDEVHYWHKHSAIPERWSEKEQQVERLFVLINGDRLKDEPEYASDPKTKEIIWKNTWMVRLDDNADADVVTLDFKVLTKGKDILTAARSAAAIDPEKKPQREVVHVPSSTPAFQKLWAGSSVMLIVPRDSRLETAARRWLGSKEEEFRDQGVRALRHFKSEENIRILKPYLADPSISTYESNGVKKRVYPLRIAAYETLKEWGVAVEKPVLEEPVPSP